MLRDAGDSGKVFLMVAWFTNLRCAETCFNVQFRVTYRRKIDGNASCMMHGT